MVMHIVLAKCMKPPWRHAQRCSRWLLAGLLVGGYASASLAKSPADHAKIDFNRDVRPIFSEHCYACHGPDQQKRKAGLRLDVQEDAFKELKSGSRALVAGDLKNSALVERITSTEEEEIMPPAKHNKPLTAEQIALLQRWVQEGAQWKKHWSFIPPERPELPTVNDRKWPRNAIDYFALARLEKEKLKPEAEADKPTLIRRVTFDLTGLPPTIAEVDAFLADKSRDAYEQLVDRLLASPHYGERMAQNWMDLARYADTSGYHFDGVRFMWLWRDWVIKAFNENKPYDEFTVEQLAGDLLPEPTQSQRIATGFVRNNMTNDEGGADPDEYLNKYVVDRVNTVGAVWMGLTVGCTECHDHKLRSDDDEGILPDVRVLPQRAGEGAGPHPDGQPASAAAGTHGGAGVEICRSGLHVEGRGEDLAGSFQRTGRNPGEMGTRNQ
jgi:mono/diheme cytochrome c family protein